MAHYLSSSDKTKFIRMTLLAIPNFGDRISPRLDYAETLQLITVENKEVMRKETIKIIANNTLERINLIIGLKPDIVICDGVSSLVHEKFSENNIRVIPWIHGTVDDIVGMFISKLFDQKK